MGGDRQPVLVDLARSTRSTSATCTPVTGSAACWPGCPTPTHVEAAVADLREVLATTTDGRRGGADRRADPGRRRLRAPARTGCSPRTARSSTSTGILFISDEVQTGWGRTGEHFWGYQAHGVVPDLLTFAKGIGNGFALAGVVGRAEVINAVAGDLVLHVRRQPGLHRRPATPSSTTCSTTTCRATRAGGRDPAATGCARRRRARDRRRRAGQGSDARGRVRRARYAEPERRTPPVGSSRSAGRGGLLVGKGGLYGNTIRMGPPLTLTEEEAREGLEILLDAIATVDAEVPG